MCGIEACVEGYNTRRTDDDRLSIVVGVPFGVYAFESSRVLLGHLQGNCQQSPVVVDIRSNVLAVS